MIDLAGEGLDADKGDAGGVDGGDGFVGATEAEGAVEVLGDGADVLRDLPFDCAQDEIF